MDWPDRALFRGPKQIDPQLRAALERFLAGERIDEAEPPPSMSLLLPLSVGFGAANDEAS